MSRLSDFIRNNREQILLEWETFARSLPMGGSMDIAALRDHANEMLGVIARDLETPQTRRQEIDKAEGKQDADERTLTAAQEHGAGRADRGFAIEHMVAEFRSLRASVIRLWTAERREFGVTDLEDMTRFNEAIDQAVAESIVRYTQEIGLSKDRFLAILGHDLRTPLSAIITSTRFILETDELTEPYLTLVTLMSSSANRMNQMVADLLEFTRTRFGGSIPIVRDEADIGKIVYDVAAEVGASYPESVLQIETDGNLRGRWDCQRLTQALTNLVSNAVQHGSDRSPINIAVRGTPDEVVIAVQNDGVIPEEQLGRIFGAMSRGVPESTQDRGHLGLGLYIVDKIVTAHSGSIDVRSSKEQGTTFTIHLPRQA